MGDHRLHAIDFSAESVTGTNLPTVTKRSGRKLQWKIKPSRWKYTKDLIKQSKYHKLDKKLLELRKPENYVDEVEYREAREAYDKQHCELQLGCEKTCRAYKLGDVDWFRLLTTINVHLRIYR